MTSYSAPSSLSELSSDLLTSRIAELLSDERRCVLALLWHLAEMERRRVYLDLGFPSLFAWCRDVLHLSKGSTYRRITAAKLLVRFPLIADYLVDGRLSLSTLVLLKDVLDPDNLRGLLDSAAGRTEDEVQVLVVTLRPKPEVKDSIRRLPLRSVTPESTDLLTLAAPLPVTTPVPAELLTPTAVPAPPPALAVEATECSPLGSARNHPVNTSLVLEATPAPNRPRPRIEPIDPERHSIRFTAGSEFMSTFSELKSALSHQIPDGNLEAVLLHAMKKALEACNARKYGATKSARAPKPPEPTSSEAQTESPGNTQPDTQADTQAEAQKDTRSRRYIPRAVRRAVKQRDGDGCAFIGADGKRCGSKYQLEFEHVQPHALGGPSTAANLELFCRPHNLHLARQRFGEAHMARYARNSS